MLADSVRTDPGESAARLEAGETGVGVGAEKLDYLPDIERVPRRGQGDVASLGPAGDLAGASSEATLSIEDTLGRVAKALAPRRAVQVLAALRGAVVRLRETLAASGPEGIARASLVEALTDTTLNIEQARALFAAMAGRLFIEANGRCRLVTEPKPVPLACVPWFITKQMEAELRVLGHDDQAIGVMKPEQAHQILQAGTRAPAGGPVSPEPVTPEPGEFDWGPEP